MATPHPNALLPSIWQALAGRYRNLADPWHGWVQPAYDAVPYKAVVDRLAALGCSVQDDTDLNNDVSCRYFVRRGGAFVIAELSLVGPYAVMLDGEGAVAGPVTPGNAPPGLAQDVLQVLQAHGVHVLDAAMLCTPVDMPFTNVEAGQGTLYQALVADTPGPLMGQGDRSMP